MKKHLFVVFAFLAIIGFQPEVKAQAELNTVLEYCTGTWCQWCPCGHTIINNFLINHPNTMVLAYHGAGSDPWQTYSAGIRGIFGMNSYPTGIVGRRTGVISRSAWAGWVNYQSTLPAGVSIAVTSKSYNTGSRTITMTVVTTALMNLDGMYNINFVLTEDNLVYGQTGNSSCPPAYDPNYVHNHVVKGMINGDLGQPLNTVDPWPTSTQITTNLNYVIPSGFVPENCKINIFAYKTSGALSTAGDVQQTRIEGVTSPVGISGQNGTIPEAYSLEQNYPNPFNPTTNIKFSIPKEGIVSLKFYDMLGKEVSTYLDGFLKAGIYNAEFDASELSSGIYFYTLKTNEFIETKKMMLVK